MLIYNQNKEFIGIDDEDLRLLGFTSLKELLAQCSDIAELFVKKPGYIHDFKNFQWIDFVLHADADVSKAIIRTNEKEFSCDIVIRPFYLTQSPEDEAFSVSLQHIKPLGIASAAESITKSYEPPIPATIEHPTKPVPITPKHAPIPEKEPSHQDEHPLKEETLLQPDLVDDLIPDDEIDSSSPRKEQHIPLEVEEDIFLYEEPTIVTETETVAPPSTLTSEEQVFLDKLQIPADYVFDPHVAADELGLPVDLIEEFIRDFIQQSHDFHDELLESCAKEDFENVKTLSHKLKGVAANLRVEDAFEMLAIINSSHDQREINTFLKTFYQTIARLEGKEESSPSPTPIDPIPGPEVIPETPSTPEIPEVLPEDDIYAFDVLDTEPATATETETESAPPLEPEELYSLEELTATDPGEEQTILKADEKADHGLSSPLEPASEDATQDDDIYRFDTLEQASSAQKEDQDISLGDFGADDEYELPPMDLSLLDETPAAEPETPPAPVLHYDAQKASDELGLDIGLIKELQQDFADDANQLKSELKAAVLSLQSDNWQNSASQLKGIADNLRMEQIASTLQVLTQTTDPEQAEKAMHKLYNYVDQL